MSTLHPAVTCLWPIAAIARLTWTMPDLHPGLVVVDEGTAPGAAGAVAVADGRPVSYLVASGDTLSGISARFGITVAELTYLNPLRPPEQQTVLAGERYNLDRRHRTKPVLPL